MNNTHRHRVELIPMWTLLLSSSIAGLAELTGIIGVGVYQRLEAADLSYLSGVVQQLLHPLECSPSIGTNSKNSKRSSEKIDDARTMSVGSNGHDGEVHVAMTATTTTKQQQY